MQSRSAQSTGNLHGLPPQTFSKRRLSRSSHRVQRIRILSLSADRSCPKTLRKAWPEACGFWVDGSEIHPYLIGPWVAAPRSAATYNHFLE